jgi:uncharacterized Zn finger protein (UPF0148 family)
MAKSSKFCAECGAPLVAGAKFCASCGKPSAAVATADEAPLLPADMPILELVDEPDPDDHHAHKAKHAGGKFEDPLAHLMDKEDDDDHSKDELDADDRLEMPEADVAPVKKSLPIAMIAMGLLGLLILGIIVKVSTDEELNARLQCNLLGKADKCITDEDRQAELDRKEREEEITLMTARYGQFDLNFDPPKDTSVLIVQKRYEEDRSSFIGRVSGSVPCKAQADCPANYECTGSEGNKKCIVKAGSTGDNRVMKTRKVGDFKQLDKLEDGTSKGVISFMDQQDWVKKHESDPRIELPPPPAPQPNDPPPPPAVPPTPPRPANQPVTWEPKPNKELQMPMSLATLPLLEKEQEDGTPAHKRLTADDVKKIEDMKNGPREKDAEGNVIKKPEMQVKTVAVSTWVYEIELSAPGYMPRKVLFYDDPPPPDIDLKKLEKEGWTTRKFKRTPDGKYLIDNAAFDLTPTPRVLVNRYMQYLEQSKCMKEAPEWKGKPDQGKKDADDLLWEQLMFTKEKREIALKLEDDPEFKTWRDLIMKDYKCPKAN